METYIAPERGSKQIAGCLSNIFSLPFRLIAWLFSAERRKVTLIVLGSFILFCCFCMVTSVAMDKMGLVPTLTPTPPQTATLPPTTVKLTLEPHIESNTLYIKGTTDLPDRTILVYDVTHEQFSTNIEIPVEKLHTEDFLTVTNQSYSTSIDLTGWTTGKLTIWISFQTILGTDKKQPPDITSRFGELGEKLQGDNVTSVSGMKRIALETILEFTPTESTPNP